MSFRTLIPRFGRRTIYLGGLFGIARALSTVGILALETATNGKNVAMGALLIWINFAYNASLGPLSKYSLHGIALG